MMNQQNQDTINSSSLTAATNDLLTKRKRGRPLKDETVIRNQETNLVGKVIAGVVEGSFDAGYLLNVKVKDSDTKLKGLVFIPGRVNPITPQTDVAPLAKMYGREEIKNNHQSFLNDQPMKDAVTTDLEVHESAQALTEVSESAQDLTLVQQVSNVDQDKEATIEVASTRLVEFFPTPETTGEPNVVVVQKELVCEGENVPEELQLELGNKTTLSGDNNKKISMVTTETDSRTSVSKSGFIANLFKGKDKKVDNNMEEEANPPVQ